MLRLITALLLTVATAQASDRIGVVYIEKVFLKAEMVNQAYGDFKKEADGIRDQIQGYTTQIENLKTVLSTYHPSDAKFFEKKRELETLGLHRKMFVEHHQARLEKSEVDILAKVYGDVRKELNAYANENGFKMVLLGTDGDLTGVGSMNELRLQLATRTVLYYQDDDDITEAFIEHLDKKFATPVASPITPVIGE